MLPQWTSQRDSLHKEIAHLRQELDEKDCKIRYLEELMLQPDVELRNHWHLTETEDKILRILLSGGIKSRTTFMTLVYDFREPGDRVLDVFIAHLRQKLAPDGIEIRTIWGRGYRIDDVDIARIKQLCVEQVAA